jgi:hypothetical protein
MKPVYLEKIKELFKKEKISELDFIQGLKIYDITKHLSEVSVYKKRPYVLYKGAKQNKKVIIKILIRENYFKFYQRELFVYKFLPQIIPHSKKILPELISYGNNPSYMIIKYYEDFFDLGDSSFLKVKLKKEELENILQAIDSFHVLRREFEKKLEDVKLPRVFKVSEPYSFYFQRYLRETKNTLIKILGEKETERLEKFFLKTQPIFNKAEKYFSWGDANPANILIKREEEKFHFKFIDFEKVDYSPFVRDYTTLFYSIYLADEKLALFLKKWLEEKYHSFNFWIIFYFKLLIYSLPRQFSNFGLAKDFQKQKRITEFVRMFLSEYYFLFNHYENRDDRFQHFAHK